MFFNFSGRNCVQLNSAIQSILLCIFRTYYQCQANGARRGGYEAILKHCAAGTAFDPKSGICNHVSSLSCEKEPSQSVDPFELRGTPKITNTDIAYKQIPHTTQNSHNKWTKILSLEMTIFGLNMMVKSGLEKIILKFHVPLQSCCCPVQKNLPRKAELAWLVSRYL